MFYKIVFRDRMGEKREHEDEGSVVWVFQDIGFIR